MTEEHKERIIREKGEIEKIYVKTMTFDDLMSNYPGRRHIDFMSLDTEGAEMSILETIEFEKFSFGFITVESNEETPGDSERLIQFMDARGYKVYLHWRFDIMFVPKGQ